MFVAGCHCLFCNPPASKGSREEANLTERKNPRTPVYGIKEFVCLSVHLSVTNFDPNYDLSYNQIQKPLKKVCNFCCQSFVSMFFFKNS